MTDILWHAQSKSATENFLWLVHTVATQLVRFLYSSLFCSKANKYPLVSLSYACCKAMHRRIIVTGETGRMSDDSSYLRHCSSIFYEENTVITCSSISWCINSRYSRIIKTPCQHLTMWNSVALEQLLVLCLTRNSPHCIGPEGSLPCSHTILSFVPVMGQINPIHTPPNPLL